MVAQTGRGVLIKVYNGSSYVTVGGLTVQSMTINGGMVDVTDIDSANQWRELLENGGTKSMTMTGNGIFKDDAAIELVRAQVHSQSLINYQFVIPGQGTYQGSFQLTQFKEDGGINTSVTYNATWESAGEITYTAA